MKIKLLIIVCVLAAYTIGFFSSKAITMKQNKSGNNVETVTSGFDDNTSGYPYAPRSECLQIPGNTLCALGGILTLMFPELVLDVSLSTCDSIEVKNIRAIASGILQGAPENAIGYSQIDSLLGILKILRFQIMINSKCDFGSIGAAQYAHGVLDCWDHSVAETNYYCALGELMTDPPDCSAAKIVYEEYLKRGGTKKLVELEKKCKGL